MVMSKQTMTTTMLTSSCCLAIMVKLHACRSLTGGDDEIKIFAPLLQPHNRLDCSWVLHCAAFSFDVVILHRMKIKKVQLQPHPTFVRASCIAMSDLCVLQSSNAIHSPNVSGSHSQPLSPRPECQSCPRIPNLGGMTNSNSNKIPNLVGKTNNNNNTTTTTTTIKT